MSAVASVTNAPLAKQIRCQIQSSIMSESLVAIVTGGAQGLGAAMCGVLLRKGYKICVADVKEETGRQFVKDLQEKHGVENVEFVVCDVSKENDYIETFDFTVKQFKKIDLVVNNAGIVLEQNARRTIDVNLMGQIIGCQLALKYMGKSNGGRGGMVINTASILGFRSNYALPVYTATKHGVIGLTRSYGDPYHLERDGVLFTAICPSLTDTAMLHCRTNTLLPGSDLYKDREVMSPQYVAEGILKLLEDRINGSALLVTTIGYTYIVYQEVFQGIPFS